MNAAMREADRARKGQRGRKRERDHAREHECALAVSALLSVMRRARTRHDTHLTQTL